MDCFHRFINLLLIFPAQDSKLAGIWITSGSHNIMAGHKLRFHTVRQDYRHLGRQVTERQLREICICDLYISGNDLELACDTFEDRGFAGTIRSDQCHDLSFFDSDTDVMDQGFSVIADCQIIHIYILLCHITVFLSDVSASLR